MMITRLGGIRSDDVTLDPGFEKIEGLFLANGTITVGTVVGLIGTTGTNVTGATITSQALISPLGASASSDHMLIGIFEGKGKLSGLPTTTLGLSGQHARTGDICLVTIYGQAKVFVDGTTTDAAPGNALAPSSVTTGELQSLANTFTAGVPAPIIHLDRSVTDTTSLVSYVYVRCM